MAQTNNQSKLKEKKGEQTPIKLEDLAYIREIFMEFSDNKQTISYKRIEPLLKNLGINIIESELLMLLERLDQRCNRDMIPFPDFIRALDQTIQSVHKEDECRSTFKVLDVAQDGTIDMNDIQTVLHNMGHNCSERELDQLLKVVQVGNNRRINYEAFESLVKEKLSQLPDVPVAVKPSSELSQPQIKSTVTTKSSVIQVVPASRSNSTRKDSVKKSLSKRLQNGSSSQRSKTRVETTKSSKSK